MERTDRECKASIVSRKTMRFQALLRQLLLAENAGRLGLEPAALVGSWNTTPIGKHQQSERTIDFVECKISSVRSPLRLKLVSGIAISVAAGRLPPRGFAVTALSQSLKFSFLFSCEYIFC